MLTGLVEPKLSVGRYLEPAGLDVMAAVSPTLPVNPPLGVTVFFEAFPIAAPAVTVTAVPLMMKAVVDRLMV
jgi:hypothetical protein